MSEGRKQSRKNVSKKDGEEVVVIHRGEWAGETPSMGTEEQTKGWHRVSRLWGIHGTREGLSSGWVFIILHVMQGVIES